VFGRLSDAETQYSAVQHNKKDQMSRSDNIFIAVPRQRRIKAQALGKDTNKNQSPVRGGISELFVQTVI